MKTICLLVIGVSLSMQWSFGQASYRFANYSSSFGIDAPVYDWDGELLNGSTWRFELYGGATQDSLSPVVPLDGDLNRAIIPRWRPGYFRADLALDGNPILVVPDVPGSGWAWLQVKAWDVGLGSTYEEAVAKGLGGYGQSMMFYAQGGYATAPLPTLPFPLTGLQSFSVLQTIPEPSLWTLLALGSVLALQNEAEQNQNPPGHAIAGHGQPHGYLDPQLSQPMLPTVTMIPSGLRPAWILRGDVRTREL